MLTESTQPTPVDVEFESLFRQLQKVSFRLKAEPGDEVLQKQFCQILRECKIAFETVVDAYGSRYRGGDGARLLINQADETIALLLQHQAGKIMGSIERHRARIKELHATYFHAEPPVGTISPQYP